jgi:hypothetical protein
MPTASPGPHLAGPGANLRNTPYLSDDETVLNTLEIAVPAPLTALMIAIAMPAAISAYSIAVAPVSSLMKRETRFFIGTPDRQFVTCIKPCTALTGYLSESGEQKKKQPGQ